MGKGTHLHDQFNAFWANGQVEQLLLIGAYVLDFLCIHPFTDGNGRLGRLISLLLLYRVGYEVGRYISLERIIEETRESYYDALAKSSVDWHEGGHSLLPWWEYFTGVMLLTTYRRFEGRLEILAGDRGAKRRLILDTIKGLPREFRYAEVGKSCPGISRSTMTRVFKELRESGKLTCIKTGRNATWRKL